MIWGVDLGVRHLHMVGLPVKDDEDTQFLSFMAERTSRWEELSALARMFQERVIFTDFVFIEEPPLAGSRNVRTLLQLGQISGALLAVSSGRTYLVPVSSWKAEIVRHGSASKEMVRDWLADHHPALASRSNGDQNFMDAACIALYGQNIIEGAAGKDL